MSEDTISPKKIVPTLIFCWILGIFGVHRFFVGKVGTGILQLVTLGGFGIWTLIDFIFIVLGKFRDKEGNIISEWT